jgi:mitofusin
MKVFSHFYKHWHTKLFYLELKGDNQKLVPDEQLNEVERSKEMIKTVKSMLGRDKMKVVFFGRTSNGKSSVINAMLHSKILPQGMGHTTCCFIQVEGGTNGDQHFIVEGSNEKVPLSELNKVGHAICAGDKLNKSLGSNTLIRVMYPKSTSKLLQNEVLLVDRCDEICIYFYIIRIKIHIF